MIMLDILTIVHGFADTRTASRIRRICRRLSVLIPQPILYSEPGGYIKYNYKIDGKLHRLDGPAWRDIYGSKFWYRGGICHREYHPQAIYDESKEYMVEGVYHRETGPSYVDDYDELWYMRGQLHRKIGPANTWSGGYWYTLGKYHRLDDPAYEKVYMIRGIAHRISCPIYDLWMVDGAIIRK